MGEESRAREGQAGIEPKPVQAKCHLPVPAAPWTLTGQAWFRGEGRKPSLQHLEVTPVARIRVHQGPELHQTPIFSPKMAEQLLDILNDKKPLVSGIVIMIVKAIPSVIKGIPNLMKI